MIARLLRSVGMARLVLIARLAVALVAAGGAAGVGLAGRGLAATPIQPRNEIVANDDAVAHLGALSLPADAVRSMDEPAGDARTLANPLSGPPATPNVVTYHDWWVLSESPAAVLQYVQAHPPPGGFQGISGASGGTGKPTVMGIGFTWPAIPGRLGTRQLLVEVVRLAGGSTGLRADSQVVWITPRPASERVPAGARRLVLVTRRLGRVIQGPLTVRSVRAIRRATRLLNALPAEQPGVTACPLDAGSQIRLAFYRGGGAGAGALAVAVVDPSGCGAVRLSIRGHSEPRLAGGAELARRLSRALGVKVDTGVGDDFQAAPRS
jgi:hypothetical protein